MSQPTVTAQPSGFATLLRARTPAQWYCLVVGGLLAVRGATTLLFGASFDQPGTGWRAIQQLAVAALLLAAQRSRSVAYRALLPVGVIYLVLWIVGVVNGHEAFGLIPIDARDMIIHPVYAVLAAAILVREARRPADRAD